MRIEKASALEKLDNTSRPATTNAGNITRLFMGALLRNR